jgi:hypothetical protein
MILRGSILLDVEAQDFLPPDNGGIFPWGFLSLGIAQYYHNNLVVGTIRGPPTGTIGNNYEPLVVL